MQLEQRGVCVNASESPAAHAPLQLPRPHPHNYSRDRHHRYPNQDFIAAGGIFAPANYSPYAHTHPMHQAPPYFNSAGSNAPPKPMPNFAGVSSGIAMHQGSFAHSTNTSTHRRSTSTPAAPLPTQPHFPSFSSSPSVHFTGSGSFPRPPLAPSAYDFSPSFPPYAASGSSLSLVTPAVQMPPPPPTAPASVQPSSARKRSREDIESVAKAQGAKGG